MNDLVRRICCCPACSGELSWEGSLSCRVCGATYALENGIPILLAAREQPPALSGDWYPGVMTVLPARLRRLAARFGPRLRPTLTFKSRHASAEVDRFVAAFDPNAVVANIGSGETSYGPNVVNLDVGPFPRVDVVGVAEQLPIADASCDGAILMAVLEHVRDADRTLLELRRILKPGGKVLVDVPFIQGFHASPGDYRRYTEPGLREPLARLGFEIEASGVAVGRGRLRRGSARSFSPCCSRVAAGAPTGC